MSTSRPSVLIVEDDVRMRDMLIRATTEAGFEPVAARSAEQAIKIMETAPRDPLIVLLDLNLPGMDGMEFLSRFRSEAPGTPVIILTGFGSLDAAKAAIRFDVADFLTKPCRLEDLEIALARARQRLIKPALSTPQPADPSTPTQPAHAPPQTLEQLEQQHILAALARNHGNRAATAAELGISERTLYYRLENYQQRGIPVE